MTISRNRVAGVAAAFIFCTLASCATVQRENAPTTADRPKSGKGLVVFYREKKLEGWAVGYNVRDGDKAIGGLPNGSYFVYDVTPGPHTFAASTESTSR